MTLKKQLLWSVLAGLIVSLAISGHATLQENWYMSKLQEGYKTCVARRPANGCPMYSVAKNPLSFPIPMSRFGVVWLFDASVVFVMLRIAGKFRKKNV